MGGDGVRNCIKSVCDKNTVFIFCLHKVPSIFKISVFVSEKIMVLTPSPSPGNFPQITRGCSSLTICTEAQEGDEEDGPEQCFF